LVTARLGMAIVIASALANTKKVAGLVRLLLFLLVIPIKIDPVNLG
jgi:hypothetical protein